MEDPHTWIDLLKFGGPALTIAILAYTAWTLWKAYRDEVKDGKESAVKTLVVLGNMTNLMTTTEKDQIRRDGETSKELRDLVISVRDLQFMLREYIARSPTEKMHRQSWGHDKQEPHDA